MGVCVNLLISNDFLKFEFYHSLILQRSQGNTGNQPFLIVLHPWPSCCLLKRNMSNESNMGLLLKRNRHRGGSGVRHESVKGETLLPCQSKSG